MPRKRKATTTLSARGKKELGYAKSFNIVVTTIKDRLNLARNVTGKLRVGELLRKEDLPSLSIELKRKVESHGFRVDASKIRIEPHQTIAELAENVSGLAGNPTLDD